VHRLVLYSYAELRRKPESRKLLHSLWDWDQGFFSVRAGFCYTQQHFQRCGLFWPSWDVGGSKIIGAAHLQADTACANLPGDPFLWDAELCFFIEPYPGLLGQVVGGTAQSSFPGFPELLVVRPIPTSLQPVWRGLEGREELCTAQWHPAPPVLGQN
jgi:hypothetical protein